MNIEATRHFVSILVTMLLKYGADIYKHLDEMADYWDGPLDEGHYFLNSTLIKSFPRRQLAKIMSNMHDFNIHAIYNRDFFQGIADGLGRKIDPRYPRLEFTGRESLLEFLESDAHGVNIKFSKFSKKRKFHRTKTLHYYHLPCHGELDRYFAGILASGKIVYDEDGCPLCRVNNKCRSKLRSLGIVFEDDGYYLTISPFYIMLFCGDLPEQVFAEWIQVIENTHHSRMIRASKDALWNWRLTFGKDQFKKNMLPFLLSRASYHDYGFRAMDLKSQMDEERIDFLDKRVKNRCKRWYNLTTM